MQIALKKIALKFNKEYASEVILSGYRKNDQGITSNQGNFHQYTAADSLPE